MTTTVEIHPFENCPALDGYHCQTNSLAKIYHYYNHPLSEDMLLGLGAGMGFIYWKTGSSVFVGGRANNDLFEDLGRRTGVQIKAISTSSRKKAETALLEKLGRKEPAMLFGDMGFLPWFNFPQDYHFGGHTFVVCGYDGDHTVLASDMDQAMSGQKRGFYSPVTLEQLSLARSSTFKPFPPNNTSIDFDFCGYRQPGVEDIYSAIRQACEMLLHPPIKNMGVRGIRHTSKEILKWSELFDDHELRMNLFNLYIFIEIGGTGGGCFRYMYSRFLAEAARIAGNDRLFQSAEKVHQAGCLFSEIGLLFKEADTAPDLNARIQKASELFMHIAELEEVTYAELLSSVN